MGQTGEGKPLSPSPTNRDYTNAVLAGIMHDLRNALTSIIGSAELAEMSADSPELKNRLNNIIQSGEHGTELVKLLHHLMDGDKPETARILVQELLPDVIERARQRLPANIRLDLDMEDDLPPLFGHVAQIEQMLFQLIGYVAHTIKDLGGISVQVQTDALHPLAAPGVPAVCLRIADSGPGIVESDLPHVSEPLWGSHKEEGANGPGLSMVQRIVRWHHGEISIGSATDGGCEISIHLPPHTAI